MKIKRLTGTVVATLGGVLLAQRMGAQEVAPGEMAQKESGSMRVNVGWAGRMGGTLRARWDGGALRGALAGKLPGSTHSSPSMVSATGYTDRDYADGFVYMDEGTTDPDTDVFGLTWYWGYDNASQYNGSSVRYHSVEVGSERDARWLSTEPGMASNDVDLNGVTLSADWVMWEGLLLGKESLSRVVVGVNYYLDEDAEFANRQAVAEVRERTYRWTDVYAAPHPGFPGAGYAGTLEGPGYLIHNQPDERTKEILSERKEVWFANSRAKVNVEQLDLRVGTLFEMAVGGRVSMALEVAAMAAYVSLELDADTSVMSGERRVAQIGQKTTEDEWVWGAGVAGSVGVDLTERWTLGGRIGVDWWADEVSVKAIPYDVEYTLGDWTASVTIQREF